MVCRVHEDVGSVGLVGGEGYKVCDGSMEGCVTAQWATTCKVFVKDVNSC